MQKKRKKIHYHFYSFVAEPNFIFRIRDYEKEIRNPFKYILLRPVLYF